jgi:hypothetical protein
MQLISLSSFILIRPPFNFVFRKIISLTFLFFLLGSLGFAKMSYAEEKNPQIIPGFYEIFVTEAITNKKILPKTYPITGISRSELTLTACRGEYEPASFVIHAHQPIKGLELAPSDLKGERSSIPVRALDIRVVKCWFQAGLSLSETNKCILTPELLLKDDKLVRVDLAVKQNFLRTPDASGTPAYVCISDPDSKSLKNIRPQDAQTLQPVDIEDNSNKQLWVTVQVPEDALPGTYQGTIRLRAANAPAAEIPLKLTVLPFALEKPALRYSIYYHGRTMPGCTGTISGAWKSPQQYLAEMKNLKAHGVEHPALQNYQGGNATLLLELDLRKQAGLPQQGQPLYSLGITIGNPTAQADLDALKAKVQERITVARQYGYGDIYFYGMDEAKGASLLSQRPAWEAVHQAGGKIFVACCDNRFMTAGLKDYDIFGMVGDLLDLAIEWGPLNPEIIKKYHNIGHQVFSYHNPQAGMEEPETYRRNYGLALWKAGYDGAMTASYQLAFNNIWDDFDYASFRDHVFAYPTADGVLDTIEWEGFREGVDDVRYLSTLLKAISRAKATKPQLASAAQAWVNRIDPQEDLDRLRAQMIDWVLKLQ